MHPRYPAQPAKQRKKVEIGGMKPVSPYSPSGEMSSGTTGNQAPKEHATPGPLRQRELQTRRRRYPVGCRLQVSVM